MKENLQAFLAGIGCTPLLAVGLFIGGAFIGEFVVMNAPPPSQWLLFSAALFPICLGLYLRASAIQKNVPHWLERWRKARQRKVVGQVTSLEEFWVQSQVQQTARKNGVKRIIDAPLVWGWATLLTFLALAYICLWLGLNVADG